MQELIPGLSLAKSPRNDQGIIAEILATSCQVGHERRLELPSYYNSRVRSSDREIM